MKAKLINHRLEAAAIIVILTVSVLLLDYARSSSKYVDTYSQENFLNMMEQMKLPFTDKLNTCRQIAEGIDKYFTSMDASRDFTVEDLLPFLGYQKESLGVYAVCFLNDSGQMLASDGTSQNIDIRDGQIMQKTTWKGKDAFLFVSPTAPFTVDEKEYTAVGVMYTTEYMSATLHLTAYDHQAYFLIVDDAYQVIFKGQHVLDEELRYHRNFLAWYLEGGNITREEAKLLEKGFAEESAGVLSSWHGEEYYLAYMSIEGTDYFFVCEVPVRVAQNILQKYQEAIVRVLSVIFFTVFIIGILFFIWNNSRNMRAKNRELQYREKMFGILSDHTDQVYALLSADMKWAEYISPNLERILKIGFEVLADPVAALNRLPDDPSLVIDEEAVGMLQNGEAWHDGEYFQSTVGAVQKYLERTIIRVSVEGSEKLLAIVTDRTLEQENRSRLRTALDIAEEANRSKSTFLSSMSHDIRTPMNAIMGFSTLLYRDAKKPEKVREYTRKITSSGHHLLSLINDVLDMSKIESGKATLSLADENIAEIVEGIDTIVRSQMKEKEHTFEIRIKDIRHEDVALDKLRFNQILLNLLSNAIKYTPEKGYISLTLQELPQHSAQLARYRIEVADNGYGMSPEYVKKIFCAFTREENQTINQIQGTGLGMAITKNLVDLMGGNISVKSEQGKGSVFTVELEFYINEKTDSSRFWEEQGIARMLVMDDAKRSCESILAAMEETKVLVDYVLDGKTAVSMTEAAKKAGHPYNVVLLDWKMPDMDGIEAAGKIRKFLSPDVSWLIMTGYDWTEFAEEAWDAGVDAVLPKPFFLSSLRHKIDELRKKAQKPKEEDPSAVTGVLEGMHILVAEDNDLNAEILCELLDMAGASCEVCENGRQTVEAFERSEEGQYQLILMDVQMPVMGGYEATRLIRDLEHPEARTIPIVAMTANAFTEDINRALEAGMNAHVAKPVDMGVLEATVREVLEVLSTADDRR